MRRDSRLLFAESGFDSRSDDGCGVGGLRALLDSTGWLGRASASRPPQGSGRNPLGYADRFAVAGPARRARSLELSLSTIPALDRGGVWDVILAAFVDSDASYNVMQMIDSTIVRAHHHAAGGRGGLIATVSAVRAVASRPSSMLGRMPKGSRSASL